MEFRRSDGRPSPDGSDDGSEQERRRQGYLFMGALMAVGMLAAAVQQARKGDGLEAALAGAACLVCLAAVELSRRGRLRLAAAVFLTGVLACGLPGYLAQM
ncbi:hypothetical protein [Streptomyces sp. NPDC050145]|uniref:hypothetical protein n=1 Tax=Streptomyces sp. NPDC050145 TaxID=3365602 RepID=UPI00378EA3C6